ncbi:MAG TPA: hypothetical protein VLA82_13645 [Actinomycetota bacterium]|nr:hypothetical protein [Actinomycetota bacterium]
MKRALGSLVASLSLFATLVAVVPPAVARAEPLPYRPDQWIKLCGLSMGCTIDPLPHPWRGKDVYNDTGRRQRVSVRMEDGEGVRFWLALQNDGTERDTFFVKGCRGNKRFNVNNVHLGRIKGLGTADTKITDAFKDGTAAFTFPSSLERNKRVYLTLNIIAPTTAEGVSYRCPVTITSKNDPERTDTVVARMTTY